MLTAQIEFKVAVKQGGGINVQEVVTAEAVQKIQTSIPNTSVDKEVDLAPVRREGIVLLIIKSSRYDVNNSGLLKYKIGNHATYYNLDAPHVFRGQGQAQFLPTDPSNIKVCNNLGQDVELEVIVLWNTTIG